MALTDALLALIQVAQQELAGLHEGYTCLHLVGILGLLLARSSLDQRLRNAVFEAEMLLETIIEVEAPPEVGWNWPGDSCHFSRLDIDQLLKRRLIDSK